MSELLQQSYNYCRDVMRQATSTFYLASRFFSPEVRPNLYAVYAFCRIADDIADSGTLSTHDRLAEIGLMRRALETRRYADDDLLWLAFFDTLKKHNIPVKYFIDLLDGMIFDIEGRTIQTEADFELYCYRVAGTVGAICAHILTNQPSNEVVEASIRLGRAMQYTNILRDVSADAQIHRVYLPADLMRRYTLTRDNILQGEAADSLAQLLATLAKKAHAHYDYAEIGIKLLPRKHQRPVLVALNLYRAILEKIEHNNYQVYNKRTRLSLLHKCIVALRAS